MITVLFLVSPPFPERILQIQRKNQAKTKLPATEKISGPPTRSTKAGSTKNTSVEMNGDLAIISRKKGNQEVVAFANFGDSPVKRPTLKGIWKERINSNEERFGGNGNTDGIQPYSIVILEKNVNAT